MRGAAKNAGTFDFVDDLHRRGAIEADHAGDIGLTQPAAMMKDAEDCEMPYRQVAVHDRVDFGDQRAPGRIQQKAEIATEFGRQQLRQIGSFNWGSHQQKKSVLMSVSVIQTGSASVRERVCK